MFVALIWIAVMFALETNQGHSVIFEFDPNTALQTLGEYEGYSTSFKGFLSTVVDIIVT